MTVQVNAFLREERDTLRAALEKCRYRLKDYAYTDADIVAIQAADDALGEE